MYGPYKSVYIKHEYLSLDVCNKYTEYARFIVLYLEVETSEVLGLGR
jgi:hypothetical protein